MAEDEIVKHTKAVYKAWKNPNTSWQAKTKEIVTEILIITFAISLSVWLHNWSDTLHERKEEKEFLTSLREDVQQDILDTQAERKFYTSTIKGYNYFLNVSTGAPLNPDSGLTYIHVFFSSTELEPHTSHYEALKGSGKFGIIEDKHMLGDIINLHEESIKRLSALNGYYYEYLQRMTAFIQEHVQLNKAGDNFNNTEGLVRASPMRLLMTAGKGIIDSNIFQAEDSCTVKCNRLLTEIDKALK